MTSFETQRHTQTKMIKYRFFLNHQGLRQDKIQPWVLAGLPQQPSWGG